MECPRVVSVRRPMSRRRAVILAAGVLCAGLLGQRQAPGGETVGPVSYQGLVTEGGTRPTGSRDFRFRIYDADVAGVLLWDSNTVSLTVTEGLYAVLLGSGGAGTNDPIPVSVFEGHSAVWLEVAYQGTVLAPRERIATAPYAGVSKTVDDNAITSAKISNGTIVNDDVSASAAIGGTKISPNFGDQNILTTGKVGVGVPGPVEKLEVAGTVKATAFQGSGAGLTGLPCWSLAGNAGTTPGTDYLGTSDNKALEVKVNNVRALRLEPTTADASGRIPPNVLGGSYTNAATSGVRGATVAGGGSHLANENNLVTDDFGTIGGGLRNLAGDGSPPTTSATYATVAGGYRNAALEQYTTVGGGDYNIASNSWATIPGGYYNAASGLCSFAAGNRAVANHPGSFVWGDSSVDADVCSFGNNTFTARCAGGARFYSNAAMNLGVWLSASGASWVGISDRNRKKNIREISGEEVLSKVAAMPVTAWNFDVEEDDATPHIGPMAQDFKGAFYPGRDDKSISTLEADGVHFAAIKALEKRTAELREENAQLRSQNEQLAAQVAKLREAVDQVQARLPAK